MAQGLRRVLDDQVLLERRFWLSTHADVHATARIRGIRSWLRGLVAERRSDLTPYGLQ